MFDIEVNNDEEKIKENFNSEDGINQYDTNQYNSAGLHFHFDFKSICIRITLAS